MVTIHMGRSTQTIGFEEWKLEVQSKNTLVATHSHLYHLRAMQEILGYRCTCRGRGRGRGRNRGRGKDRGRGRNRE